MQMKMNVPMSTDLANQIGQAWAGPPPTLPTAWQDPVHLEHHDAYLAFNGKTWDCFDCNDNPRYFHALNYFIGGCTEAASYYLASYMTCFFSTFGDDFELIRDAIFLYLGAIAEDPVSFSLSIERCQVVEIFLREVSGKVEWPDYPEILSSWVHAVEVACGTSPPK